MTWTSEEVYAKDLQPGDRFTSRWQGDHTVAMSEACTVVTTAYRPLGGLNIEIEMPSGDHATRVFNAGNRVFRWTESSEGEPEVAAAVKGLGPGTAYALGFLPDALVNQILGEREEAFDSFAASYAAEASEDSEADPFPTELEKVKALELHLGIRDFHDDKILELRRELRAMWGDD